MQPDSLQSLCAGFSLKTRLAYHETAFCRNLGLLDANEQYRLADSVVAIAGLGGVGGVHLITLARTGIGRFKLADFDRFSPVNVNRQYGGTVSSFGHKKLDVMMENALQVNPYLDITPYPEGVTEQNLDDFLDGVDLVVDGLDFFVFETRRMVFKRALERGIPVITAGPMGFSSATLVFTPDGMGFDEYFDIRENDTYFERVLKFALGLSPRPTHLRYIDVNAVSLTEKRGPSLGAACQLCASFTATEAVRLLTGRKGVRPAPYYIQFDPYVRKLVTGRLWWGNRGPLQRLKFKVISKFVLNRGSVVGPVQPKEPEVGAPLPAVREYVIRAGLQAPSGDNVQPWRFRERDNVVEIAADEAADHSFFNFRQSATLISCGAAVENMTLAANACGMAAEVALAPDGRPGARLTLTPAEPRESVLHDVIWRRNTNRKAFRKTPVTATVWELAQEAIRDLEGVHLAWISDRDQLKRFSRAVYLADRIRTEHRGLHEHLIKMLRFSQTSAAETRDGLPLKNLEGGLAGDLLMRSTQKWAVMRCLNAVGIGRSVAGFSAMRILQSGGVGFLSADAFDVPTFLRAGRALERVWLTMTHHNIRVQPAAAPALFRLRCLHEGEAGFAPSHRRLLDKAWPLVEACFPGFLAATPVLFFRVGFGSVIRYGTYRRSLAGFLESD